MEGEPMEDRTVNDEVSPPSPNPCHSLSLSNAQCPSLWRSHLSPSFSPLSCQDSAAEDVIYAHLDLGTLSERRFTPTPLRPMHPSTEPIIYEEFDANQDCAEPWIGPILWAHRVLQIKDLDLLLKGFLMDTPSPPKQPSNSEVRSGVQELQYRLQKSHHLLMISWLF